MATQLTNVEQMWDIDGNDRARTQVRLFFLYVKGGRQVHDARSGPHQYPHRIKPITPLTTGLGMSMAVKTAAVPMICGAIGLWGVFASHARAAEWYLWTWLPRLLLFVLAETTRWPVAHTFLYLLWLFMIAFRLFKLLYYIKVVWSYQEVLKRRIYRAPP
ncbi:unnamed protein product [Ectocarpus sp. 8 AP-2014]